MVKIRFKKIDRKSSNTYAVFGGEREGEVGVVLQDTRIFYNVLCTLRYNSVFDRNMRIFDDFFQHFTFLLTD